MRRFEREVKREEPDMCVCARACASGCVCQAVSVDMCAHVCVVGRVCVRTSARQPP